MSTQSHFQASGTTATGDSTTGAAALARVPPLESGDCLSREEFERRYEAMPELKKAELIDGVVYVGSPVSHAHGAADGRLALCLSTYAALTPNTEYAINTTVRFDASNEVQPDALLRLKTGGLSKIAQDKDYLEGPPELVVEVALTSAGRDLHSKLNLYRRHAVPEYIVWRVLDNEVDWFVLREGNFDSLAPDENGICRSGRFPGLWLDRGALLRGDMAAVLTALQQGLSSPEHAAFVSGPQADPSSAAIQPSQP